MRPGFRYDGRCDFWHTIPENMYRQATHSHMPCPPIDKAACSAEQAVVGRAGAVGAACIAGCIGQVSHIEAQHAQNAREQLLRRLLL